MNATKQQWDATVVLGNDLTYDLAITRFQNDVEAHIDNGARAIMLDLGNVRAINSICITKILYLHKRIWHLNGRMVLANLSSKTREIFHELHLNHFLNIS